MANNRMYLCCTICANAPDTTYEQCVFFLAKYYPTQGWYIRGGKTLQNDDGTPVDFVDVADAWFDQHNHGGMYGEYIFTVFESALGDPVTMTKRQILEAVGQAMRGKL